MAGIVLWGCGAGDRERIESSGSIRLGTDATFAPFAYTDTVSHAVVGFDIDLARELFGRLGYRIEIVPTALDDLVPALHFGRCDVVMSAFSLTAERQEQVLFSRPYFATDLVVVVAADDSSIYSIADLVGRRIGVERGSTGERVGERIFRAEVFRYDSIQQAFDALETGQLAAIINDRPSSALFVAHGLHLRIIGDQLERERYAAAFRRTDAWLEQRFDSVLVAFLADPGFDVLLQRYGLSRAAGPLPAAP
jgi:polar amino acid transport system substrate-binding protein